MTTVDPTRSATYPTTPTATPPDSLGKDAFLKLLVAQLKYQDPMNPAEGAEFMAQTAQFTMVERLEELTRTNTALLSVQHTLVGSSLIGRDITYPGPNGLDVRGTVETVRMGVNGPELRVGSDEVPLGQVKEIAPRRA